MTLLNITALSAALAMDAFAVAIAVGICLRVIHWRQKFRLAWHFGLFQAVMTVIGWALGLAVRNVIASYDHWVAFWVVVFGGPEHVA